MNRAYHTRRRARLDESEGELDSNLNDLTGDLRLLLEALEDPNDSVDSAFDFYELIPGAEEQEASSLASSLQSDDSDSHTPSDSDVPSDCETEMTNRRLILNSDLAQVPAQLRFWEASIPDDANGRKKLQLLMDALSGSMHLRLLQPFITTDSMATYEKLKSAICASIEQNVGQMVLTPIRQDPLGVLRSLKIRFPASTRTELLDLIRAHLDDEAYSRYRRSTEDLEKLVQLDTELRAKQQISEQISDHGPALRTAFSSAAPADQEIHHLSDKLDKHTAILQSIADSLKQPAQGSVQQISSSRSAGTARPAGDQLDQMITALHKTVDALTTALRQTQSPSNQLANSRPQRCTAHERYRGGAYSCRPPCQDFDRTIFTDHDQRTGTFYNPQMRPARGASTRLNHIQANDTQEQAALQGNFQQQLQQIQNLLTSLAIPQDSNQQN